MFSKASDQKVAGLADTIATYGQKLHDIPVWAWAAVGLVIIIWIVRSGTKRVRM